jgi:ATP-dependent protease ClpP protease subunit
MDGVTCQASGIVASMATSIFESCQHRVMLDTAVLMIHGASMGEVDGHLGSLENAVAALRALDLAMANGIAKHSKISAAFVLDKISGSKEWWIASDEALAFGLTDEVK